MCGETRIPRDMCTRNTKLGETCIIVTQGDKLQSILAKHSALFQQGIGTIQGYTADARLQANAKPIFNKSRPVAYALQPALDKELQYLQQAEILEPVEFSKWATPLVVVPKTNGRLRMCGDYKVAINQSVEKKVYPLPTAEDLFTQLAGGIVFPSWTCPKHTNSYPLTRIASNY